MAPEYFFPLLGMMFALAWGVLGTFRWYAKEKLRSSSQRWLDDGEQAERLGALEGRVGELEERLDFAERVLAQQRQSGQLPEGG